MAVTLPSGTRLGNPNAPLSADAGGANAGAGIVLASNRYSARRLRTPMVERGLVPSARSGAIRVRELPDEKVHRPSRLALATSVPAFRADMRVQRPLAVSQNVGGDIVRAMINYKFYTGRTVAPLQGSRSKRP